jgi:hypothetical protein
MQKSIVLNIVSYHDVYTVKKIGLLRNLCPGEEPF